MKKLMSLALVVVMVLGCISLVACNGGGGATTTPPPGTTTPPPGTTTPPPGTTTPPPDETTTPPEETLEDILGRGAAITAVEYEASVSTSGYPTQTMHIWFEQGNIRTEITTAEGTLVMIANFGTQVAYLYYPSMGVAYQMSFEEAAELPIPDAQAIPDYAYEILGTVTLNGMECLVVEYTTAEATVKIWIWKDYGFPVKAEMTTSSGTSTAEATNIVFGDIEDSQFELPPGVTILSAP